MLSTCYRLNIISKQHMSKKICFYQKNISNYIHSKTMNKLIIMYIVHSLDSIRFLSIFLLFCYLLPSSSLSFPLSFFFFLAFFFHLFYHSESFFVILLLSSFFPLFYHSLISFVILPPSINFSSSIFLSICPLLFFYQFLHLSFFINSFSFFLSSISLPLFLY